VGISPAFDHVASWRKKPQEMLITILAQPAGNVKIESCRNTENMEEVKNVSVFVVRVRGEREKRDRVRVGVRERKT
jgi:hypothetical protein